MAFIRYIEEGEASPELRELYDHFRDPNGRVNNVLRIQGHNPQAMPAHRQLYIALMQGRSGLTHVQREMIAVVVSSINGCHY